jgi:hypothetical protein
VNLEEERADACPADKMPAITQAFRHFGLRAVESREGVTGTCWQPVFPFPAYQTGRARFEHPAF